MEWAVPKEVKEKVAELEDTLKDTHDWIEKITGKLGWTKEHLFQKDEEMVCCPFDSGHRMPQAALEKHIKYCPLVQKGYTKAELENEESSRFFYEKASTVVPITIDQETHNQILASVNGVSPVAGGSREIPATLERAQSELTPAERLAIYRHCVEEAKKVHDLHIPDEELILLDAESANKQDKTPLSYVETLKAMRDMKRRRQSYRAKNVHTTKKSHTQIVKEVIDSQMDILTQIWRGDEKLNKDEGDKRSSTPKPESVESRLHPEDSPRNRRDAFQDDHRGDRYRSKKSRNESPHFGVVVKQEKDESFRAESRERSSYRDRDRRDDYGRERDYRRDRSRRSSPDDRHRRHERRKPDRGEVSSGEEERGRKPKKHKKKKKKKKHHSHKDRKRSRSRSHSRSSSSDSGRSRSRQRSRSRS